MVSIIIPTILVFVILVMVYVYPQIESIDCGQMPYVGPHCQAQVGQMKTTILIAIPLATIVGIMVSIAALLIQDKDKPRSDPWKEIEA